MRKTLQKKPKESPKGGSPVQQSDAVAPKSSSAKASFADVALRAGGVARDVRSANLRPMLCDKTAVSLTREGFIYELKLDGVRVLAEKRGDEVTLHYRSGRLTTAAYPEAVAAVRALPFDHVLLDGEIIAFDDSGLPSFQKLQSRIIGEHRAGASRASLGVEVALVAFDVLAVEGIDVMRVPLRERRKLLEQIVPESGVLCRFPQVTSDARALFQMCSERGIEGLVAKDPASIYLPGERSRGWSKIRIERSADFVVVGIAKGDAARHGIAALALASYEHGKFVGRGDVGSGMSDQDLAALAKALAGSVVKEPAVSEFTPGKDRIYVRPEIVVRIRFLHVTEAGTLRQPVFAGVRPDVAPEDCALDE